MYAIHVIVTYVTNDGWEGVRPLPTFYLDETVQGILNSDGAIKVARRILSWENLVDDLPDLRTYEINISAEKVSRL